ncbi:MAG: hypothetical protein LW832_10045 [Parachlamydia sp.]|jgi:hypothetical protein|nr:hypothetical protein [Parachlamydia sp.]
MYKTIILSVFALLMLTILFLASNLKDSYKILPGSTSGELNVPRQADWNEFTPENNTFKALFPANPQFVKETVAVPGTDMKRLYEIYASENLQGSVYMVSVITYPPNYKVVNANELLNEVMEELVASSPDNHLLESRDAEFKKQPAVDFHMVNKDYDIEGKTFLLNKTVYVLTYVVKNTDFNRQDYQLFIDNFSVPGL